MIAFPVLRPERFSLINTRHSASTQLASTLSTQLVTTTKCRALSSARSISPCSPHYPGSEGAPLSQGFRFGFLGSIDYTATRPLWESFKLIVHPERRWRARKGPTLPSPGTQEHGHLSVPSFFTTFPKRRNLGNYKMERCGYESTLTVHHPALKASSCSQLNGHARAVKVLVDIRFSVF